MKSFCTFLVLFLLYSSSFSQTPVDKGVINVGGGISLSTTSVEDDDDNINIFSFMPQGYYFVINNLAVGGHIQFLRYSHGNYASNTFGIGPGAKYYFRAGKLYPYVSGSFAYTLTTWKDRDDSQSGINLSVGGGMDIFISKNVAVEPYLRYYIMSDKYGDNDSVFSHKIELGVVFAGFIY